MSKDTQIRIDGGIPLIIPLTENTTEEDIQNSFDDWWTSEGLDQFITHLETEGQIEQPNLYHE